MSHGLDDVGAVAPTVPTTGIVGAVERLVAAVNRLVVIASSIALVAAALVLTYSVVVRYFLKISTNWQDETSVFLIIGAVFMSSAEVQARRGHVAIEAIAVLFSARADRIRMLLVDLTSLAFCAYFAWKSWTLLDEAWTENYHSGSTWAPPLWIPYSLMSVGMTLLTVQILLQLLAAPDRRAPAP